MGFLNELVLFFIWLFGGAIGIGLAIWATPKAFALGLFFIYLGATALWLITAIARSGDGT